MGDGDEKVTKYLVLSHLTVDGNVDEPSWRMLLADFDALASGVVGGTAVA